jgi:hypothetical protein
VLWIAPWVIAGVMNGPAFDTDIETQPVPELEPGTVAILDNLSTHKGPRAAEALKRHGCWLSFLPPYSPDLNPGNWRSRSSNPTCDGSGPELPSLCLKFLATSATSSMHRNTGTPSRLLDMPQVKSKTL